MVKNFFVEMGDMLFKYRDISIFDLFWFAVWVRWGVPALSEQFSPLPLIFLCFLVGGVYGLISGYCSMKLTKR